MDELTLIIVRAIVAVAVTMITGFVVPILKNLAANIKDQNLRRAVEMSVLAAEQTITGGGDKKADVIKYMGEWCSEHNITITDKQLDSLIESAVFAMNQSKLTS